MDNNNEKIISKKQLKNVRGLIESEILNLNSDILNLTEIADQQRNDSLNSQFLASNILEDKLLIKKIIRSSISNLINENLTAYLRQNLPNLLEPYIRQYLGSRNEDIINRKNKSKTSTNSDTGKLQEVPKISIKNYKKISLFGRKNKSVKKFKKDNNSQKFKIADLNNMTKIELENLGRKNGVELDRRRKKETLIIQLAKQLNLS